MSKQYDVSIGQYVMVDYECKSCGYIKTRYKTLPCTMDEEVNTAIKNSFIKTIPNNTIATENYECINCGKHTFDISLHQKNIPAYNVE